MVMKKNIVSGIIATLVIVLMAAPIIINIFAHTRVQTITYPELGDVISSTGSYNFKLVYVAPSSNEDIEEAQDSVKEIVGSYTTVGSTEEEPLEMVYMDYDKLDDTQKTAIFGDDKASENIAYMFIANNETLKTIVGKVSDEVLSNYVSAFSANGIPKSMQKFKVAEDAAAFSKLVKRKNTVTMAIFGRDTCFYCNQFKVVYNNVADEYDLDDIYYFDSSSYDKTEYDKIMDSGLTIPAACNNTGKDVELQTGFGTPLTLFTKNGKVIDCIDGYTNKENLITKLKTVGMIKEDQN